MIETSSQSRTHAVHALSKRLSGLPAVARLALFARSGGKAVLITTAERLELFADTRPFGVACSVDPTLSTWRERRDKVVLSLQHALTAFPADPDAYALEFALGGSYPRDALLTRLVDFGYERDEMPGFVVRGDILDLYLDAGPDAEDESRHVRLEFFGDELDRLSVRGEEARAFTLSPREGVEIAGDDASRLLTHLPGRVFLDAPELYGGELEAPLDHELAWLWAHLQEREVVSFGRDPLELKEGKTSLEPLGYYRGKLSDFRADAETWLKDGLNVTLLLRHERTGRYLRERVLDGLETRWTHGVKGADGAIALSAASLPTRGGYRDAKTREIVVTEDLLYGYQGVRKARRLPGRGVQDAVHLTVGDYLIHPDHGIGRFLGLEPRQVVGVTRDYLILQYAGEGKLYLPVEGLPLLRRHPGTTDDPPRLSTLGTNEWARARERARASAQELAQRLIRTYAERQVTPGTPLPALPEWDPKIEENFAFTLTLDQRKAIRDTLADMAKPTPMDRLISGDVGFGKTEVAIRAAHRAVGHGKQVAMLVPTTVLAKQHFETFRERFKGLPVRVDMLSRFTSDREARAVLKDVRAGKLDIVVGTHRLLADGVKFKDLGLLVIDEEHRFGVGQKERLKSMRANVDVLSLSATPIPRTLYMSLVGLRDVSQILTPPEGRKPIQTVLQPYEPMAVRSAMMFELERGGKSFYIHDRIGSMGARAMYLQRLVPEARIGVAHGGMGKDELEEVMVNFQEGAFDVLLSTTIVESGIDIAEANTLVIERADRLGLAQLYQLRGRVGRRQTEAWAYLFYPGRLTEAAQRRLYAIAELNDLGSGHLLAEKDMEIRGVGNLLGPEQHGHVSAVSLEVYTEMLAEEIAILKGEKRAGPKGVSLDLGIDARLSPSYIPDDNERISLYGRLSETDNLAEIARVQNEIRAQHGPLPQEVRAFIELAKIRLLALQKGVVSVKEHMTDVQLSFEQERIDYDARGLKSLPYAVEPTRYPPGFSLKKRGLKAEETLKAISDILYLCA